ncbi:MAG: DUF2282 domain-containing protein [Pseudomonadota bacterium]
MNQSARTKSALAAMLAAGAMLASNSVLAVPDAPSTWEKCTGVSKAGKNDCGSLDKKHSCSGQSTVGNSPQEWIYVPAGTCEKITGGVVAGLKPAK